LALAREIIVAVVTGEKVNNNGYTCDSYGYCCDGYGYCYSTSPNYMHKRDYYDGSADPVASMHFTTFAV
jgi:hypothetical protein